jgi:hypothetical protein
MWSDLNGIPDGNTTTFENLTGREHSSVVPRAEFERLAREARSTDEHGNIVQRTIFIVKPIIVPITKEKKTRTEK